MPLALRDLTEKHLDKLEEYDIITKSNSDYCCPAFVLPKKPSGIRLVVDTRSLNAVTKPENYPFPALHEQLLDLHGAKVFTQLDLSQGYHHIKISEKDRHKTAFTILGRKYEYNRMCFGLKNAPFAFQKVMTPIL